MKTNKIIEAEANLQSAKALNAISELNTALIDFYGIYDSDFNQAVKDLETLVEFFKFFAEKNRGRWTNNDQQTLKVLNSVLNITKGLRDYDMKKHCKPRLDLVDNITKGIMLKSKYEQEIEELNYRLEKAGEMYKKLQEANDNMIQATSKLLTTKEKKEREGYLNTASQYTFDQVIDRLMSEFKPKKVCNDDNELPF